MLIRQKITNLNDEYHHVDPVGMFGVLTDASGNVLRSYVFDAFSDAPYKRQYVGESFPSQSNHTGTCQTALSEPGLLTGNGGRGVVVPSRGFQVMGKKPVPTPPYACLTAPKHDIGNCSIDFSSCNSWCPIEAAACFAVMTIGAGICIASCTEESAGLGIFLCKRVCAMVAAAGYTDCALIAKSCLQNCRRKYYKCVNNGGKP